MMNEYKQVIDEHRQKVYSFAHYSLRGAEDAEDVTQEVFIKLWQHWRKIDHSRIGAWLMRVAHNAIIDHVRKQKTSQSQLDHFAEVDEQAQSTDLAREIDEDDFKQQLLLAVRELDEPFRSIIIMRDIQGLSYAEIQGVLDMSDSQVKVYLHRARRKLRENPELRTLFSSWSGESLPETGKQAATATTTD